MRNKETGNTELAEQGKEATIVTLLPDGREKYTSKFDNPEWRQSVGLEA